MNTGIAGSHSLISHLDHEPQDLQFGTSGRRGLLVHLTQLEIYINATAELEYLQSLPVSEGGIVRGESFYFAQDLRPSSSQYLAEYQGRGELAQAIQRAIADSGMVPVNLGPIPTPALTCFAIARRKGSMMVTGSHIPFDRNGYKTNTSRGELLKAHEGAINDRVREVRARLYGQDFEASIFTADGRLKSGHGDLLPASDEAAVEYLRRYIDFFGAGVLAGLRVLVYQHSAVGRDLLVDILRGLGAEAIPVGRSETFVPIDTENIDAAQLASIQTLYDEAAERAGSIDAVVSTDGDSDRPLILGVEPQTARLRFFGGDLVGMITGEFLGVDAAVVPISCNDAIDQGKLKSITEPKTRIGSPFVIAGIEKARARGKQAVCGWEANGGFLTGSDIRRGGKTLSALPTRDAILPIVAVLCAAKEKGLSLIPLFAELPRRYSRAALLKQFPRPLGLEMVRRFSPDSDFIREAVFGGERATWLDEDGKEFQAIPAQAENFLGLRAALAEFFAPDSGFGEITRINWTDGVRVYFDSGDVAHLRPSGNADELRIYAVADSQERADAIAHMAVQEPDGILRRLERFVSQFIA